MLKKFNYYLNIFFINILILYSFLYLLEIGINYKNDNLFKKTRLYYLNSSNKKKQNQKIYLNYGVYKLIDRQASLLPLSGYENSKILLCLDENNKPVYYISDKNGFNNKFYKKNDFLLIGDSYVQGMCINNKDNLNSQFKKFALKTASLGVGGNGPLIELATFKEFKDDYEYKNIILFITPSNDFKDLKNEIKNKTLLNYLYIEDYKQNLNLKKEQKKIILDTFFGNKTNRFLNDFLSVYHFNLKSVGNLIEKIFKNKQKSVTTTDYLTDIKIDNFFIRILDEFININIKDDKKIYVVFNAVNPDILYPINKKNQDLKNLLLDEKLNKLKKFLADKNIAFYDFNEYLLNNYNKKDINTMFKRINNHWDHYTEKGFFKIVEQINKNLIN